jgi:hypothetical protein
MSCTLVYKENKKNKIAVSAKISNPLLENAVSNSRTFDKIVRNPLLNNKQAVESFMNIYSDKFINAFGMWNRKEGVTKINREGLTDKQTITAGQIANKMQKPVVLYKIDKSEIIKSKNKFNIPEEFEGNYIFTTNYELANAHKPLTSQDIVVFDNSKDELKDEFINLENKKYEDIAGHEAVIEDTGEPKLFFKTIQGEVFDNYTDAIKNTNGGKIQLGFITTNEIESTTDESVFENSNADFVANENQYKLNNQDSFFTIVEIDANTDYTSVQGIINDLIKKEFISDQTVYDEGQFRLEATGDDPSTQLYNANTAKQIVEEKIGYSPENVEVIGNRFLTIDDARPNTKVMRDQEGNKVRVDNDELLEAYKNGKLNKKYKKIDSIDENIVAAEMERNGFYNIEEENKKPSNTEKQLKNQLYKILSKLGISTISMEEYAKKYKMKYGADPSIEALADIANKVVAFAEGRETVENLSEEVAHFMIEAFSDQNTIDKLASEVHTTNEWLSESDMYRKKYKEQAKNEQELDKMVRREILGKVLQNKILSRTNEEAENLEENQSIFDQLLELFDKFISRIKTFLNGDIKSEFNQTLDEIADKVVYGGIEEMLDAENIGKSGQKTYFNTKTFSDLFINLFQGLHFISEGATKNDLNFQLNLMRNSDEKTVITMSLNRFEKELNYLLQKTESIRNGKEKISGNDVLLLTSYLQNVEPLLSNLKTAIVKEKVLGDNADSYSNKIDELRNKIGDLKGMRVYIYRNNLKRLIQTIEENPNYPEHFKKKAVKMLEDELEKVGWWRNLFGIMTNSNNAFLQLMGKVIHDMTTRTNTKVVENVKPLVRFYEANNFNSQEIAKLMMSRDNEGNVDGFIISNGKYAEYEKALLEHTFNTYKKYLGDKLGEEFTLEEFEQNADNWKTKIADAIDLDRPVGTKIANEIEDFRLENEEMTMKKEYYLQQRKVNEILDLDNNTKTLVSSIRYQRWEILNKYRDKKTGKVNMQDISASDMTRLEGLNQERQKAKSEFNSVDGSRKEGDELEISLNLQKLDQYNALTFAKDKEQAIKEFNEKWGTEVKIEDITTNNRVVVQAFIDLINEIEQTEGSEKAFQTLMANGGFSFNDAFWDSFGEGSLKETLTNLLGSGTHNMDSEIKQLLDKMNEKAQLLRQFTSRYNPSEIDGNRMNESQQENIRRLEEEIANLTDLIAANVKEFREAREIRKEGSNINNNFESTVNDAYKTALKESGLDELEFLSKHMTAKNKYAFIKFGKDLLNGNITPSMIDFLIKVKGIDPNLFEDMSREEIASYFKTQILGKMTNSELKKTQIAYGYTKVSTYFKRLAPKGFAELMQNMRNGTISVASIIEQLRNPNNQTQTGTVLDFMKLNTEPSWMEDISGNTMSNPNYSGEFNGLRQFKHSSKFHNKDFFKKMGIAESDIEEFEKDMLGFDANKASRKEFALWQKFIKAKRDSLDMYGMRHNTLFELPQFSKGRINKWTTIAKNPIEGVKNAINDLVMTRVDSQEFGAKAEDGTDLQELTGVRTIPKFGVRRLEEKTDISEELIYSYCALLSHAISYEVKNEHLEEANAIGIAIQHKAEEQGLDAKKSGHYAWQQAMDNFFYGITETFKAEFDLFGKKINLGKMVRTFNGFVSGVNLAFNPFVAGTSYTTATINLHLWKSDYFDKDSYTWSQKEFWKLLPEFTADTGKRMSFSRLGQLAEIVGYEDLNERLRNASYNRFFRLMDKSPQALNEMANIPIKYSIMLATLDDVRLYKGNFIQSKVFFSLDEHKNKSKEEIRAEWENLKKDSLYNVIVTNKNGTYELRDDIKPYKEAFDKAMLYVAGMTRKANSETDGVLSKADAINIKRNWAFSAVLMHKTFLSLNIDKRFKKRHLNFTTGREEVGTYRRIWDFAEEAYKNMPDKSFGEFTKQVKEMWGKLSKEEKQEFYQVLKEWSVAVSLMVATALMASVADDDDNKDVWAIQAAAYIVFRTTSEFSQSHPLTGWKQVQETIQEPFVSMSYLKDVLKEDDFSLKEIESGRYKGLPRIGRKIMKMWYPRHYFNLKDLHNTTVNYRDQNKLALGYSHKWLED